MKTFEEDILKAHTDQMNGDITPDEYVQEIKRIFENTVSGYQLRIQKESNENWTTHAKNMEKLQAKHLKVMEKILALFVKEHKTHG